MTNKNNFKIKIDINPLEILTEEKCAEFLREIRWVNGPECPYCGSLNVRKRGKYESYFKYECLDCNRIFNDKTGTIFYKSHLPLKYWCAAMILNDLGYSILKISRILNISYDSAYRLINKLRNSEDKYMLELKEKIQELLEPIISEVERARRITKKDEIYISKEEIDAVEVSRDAVNFILDLIDAELKDVDKV